MIALGEALPSAATDQRPGQTRRAPPRAQAGLARWLHLNLFSTPANTAITLAAVTVLLATAASFTRWAVLDATLSGINRAACTGDGACWTFIKTRLPVLVFGHYPPGETWRVALAAFLLATGCTPLLRPDGQGWRWTVPLLAASVLIAGILLVGGVGPLAFIDPDDWGGLMLNGIVTVLVMLLALPLGTALALARQSPLPVPRTLAVCYIEFWRGVPLLGVLFVSAVMLPLFLPQGVTLGRLLRAVLAMGLFNAAYIAEVVRGGLQGVEEGQEEAAASLGLHPWHVHLLVTLPQALRLSIPGLVNTVIDLFKDTTLISIIGVYELLGTVSQSLRDPAWLGLAREGFAFAAAVFFVCCFVISLYSRSLERRLARGALTRV